MVSVEGDQMQVGKQHKDPRHTHTDTHTHAQNCLIELWSGVHLSRKTMKNALILYLTGRRNTRKAGGIIVVDTWQSVKEVVVQSDWLLSFPLSKTHEVPVHSKALKIQIAETMQKSGVENRHAGLPVDWNWDRSVGTSQASLVLS